MTVISLQSGKPLSLAGTIVLFSGDNPGSQLIGGFKEGPGAHLKCRHCMGTAEEIKHMVSTCIINLNNTAI